MPLYRVHESVKAVQTCTGGWELSCLWPKKVSLLMQQREALITGSRFKEVSETSDVMVMATRHTDFGSIDGVLADAADVIC